MAELTPEEKRAVQLETALKAKGYTFHREESGFYFYRKPIKDNENFSQEMGFNSKAPNAIITYFGITVAYPICCECDLEHIPEYIKAGYKEQHELCIENM